MKSKQEIRKEIKNRKDLYEAKQLIKYSDSIQDKVIHLSEFKKAKYIYCYMNCKKEVCTNQIIEEAKKENKKVAIPRVEGEEICFYEFHSYNELKQSSFGILEPVNNMKVNWEEALVIMPGLAFDKQRSRIGYGKGYYDRYLQKHNFHYKIAIAYDFQILKQIPNDKQDIKPDKIITENQIIC